MAKSIENVISIKKKVFSGTQFGIVCINTSESALDHAVCYRHSWRGENFPRPQTPNRIEEKRSAVE
jgi:hypothetical protein